MKHFAVGLTFFRYVNVIVTRLDIFPYVFCLTKNATNCAEKNSLLFTSTVNLTLC